MMADTPSNYNIPNGRLDGKSLGLKAVLMHAKKVGLASQNRTLDEGKDGKPTTQAQIMSAAAIRNRVGQHQSQVQGNLPGRGDG